MPTKKRPAVTTALAEIREIEFNVGSRRLLLHLSGAPAEAIDALTKTLWELRSLRVSIKQAQHEFSALRRQLKEK